MKEIFPSIFLLRPESATPTTQYPYLLRREGGNVLFATKDDITAYFPQIEKLGGVTHLFLGDRHHAVPRTQAAAAHLEAELTASDIEAKALASKVTVDLRLPYKRQHFAADLEIIPTPGHTRGAFSYLWKHPKGRRYLFIGDTLVPVGDEWNYYITKAQRTSMLASVELLKSIEFDVILSNSFAAGPLAWRELDSPARAKMIAGLLKRLAA